MKKRELAEFGLLRLLINILDVVILWVSMYGAFEFLDTYLPYYVQEFNFRYYIFIGVLCYLPVAMYYPPLVLQRTVRSEKVASNVFATTLLFMLLFLVALFMYREIFVARTYCISLYVLFTLLLLLERMCLHSYVVYRRSRGRHQRRVLLVGQVDEMTDLYENLMEDDYGMVVEGIFTDGNPQDIPDGVPHLGGAGEALEYLHTHGHIGAVYCSMGSLSKIDAIELYRYCESTLVRFYALPIYVNFLRRNMVVSQVGGVIMLSPREEPLREMSNRLLKRSFDIFFSLLFLLTIFPFIYVVYAIKIKCSGGGPVLLLETRSGMNGKVFNSLRFRIPREGWWAKLINTPLFLNVFKGDMSIVGPRPDRLAHVEEYSRIINQYAVRHLVQPGLTGWAQIKGEHGGLQRFGELDRRVHADIWYVENWTFWLDMRIILTTLRKIIF